MRLARFCLLIIAVTSIVASVACDDPGRGPESISFLGAESDPAEWPSATPSSVGMNEQRLANMWSNLDATPEHGLHSLLIVRHGRLVAEHYWAGFHSGVGHDLRSATKSLTSLLTGIAIDRGALRGVSEPVFPLLAVQYPVVGALDPRKGDVTVEHLLHMQSGLACDDWFSGSPGNERNMYPTRDWVRFFLDLPLIRPPGESTLYCTAGVVTLGRVVAEATNQPIPDFSRDALFAPLGIAQFRWSMFDDGRQTDTGGHIYLRPRDMAKIGQLVLQRGQWKGRQIVSASWIDRSTTEHVLLPGFQPYGYLWWIHTIAYGTRQLRYVAAQGNGGQMIMIVPELDLVVVSTAGNYDDDKTNSPLRILENRIIPAVEDSAQQP
ncbi:MAG: serine hydrolase [Gemmatimonadaceae bacterium]